ncbi:MAG: alkaline phosphatase, partial [Candidatus Parabeggiatoa sp.]|nr:alkaline phosphatase [Candidatus Parabeggiatoa sp.]
EMIGCDQFGNSAKTILEIAQDLGKSTGLVSDTRMTHATPAAFAAHQTHRSKENAIALDIASASANPSIPVGNRE